MALTAPKLTAVPHIPVYSLIQEASGALECRLWLRKLLRFQPSFHGLLKLVLSKLCRLHVCIVGLLCF